MAAKKSLVSSPADIEKQIAKLSAELDKARAQKVSDAEKNLKQAQAALAAATDRTNKSGAAATGKSKTKKVRVELEKQQQEVAAAEENLRNAKLELDIAVESAKAATQARAQLGTIDKKQPKAAKSAKKSIKQNEKKTAIKATAKAKPTKAVTKKSQLIAEQASASDTTTTKSPATVAPKVNKKRQPVSTQGAPTTTQKMEAGVEALPKARPVDYEPMGTAVTVPPASESSLLPEHGFTTLIEPRDNPLPKPQPV